MRDNEPNKESESSSEATSPKKGEQANNAPPRDPLKALAEALRAEKASAKGDDAEEQDEHEEGERPTKRKSKSKPKNLEELAEALELEAADLYEVEIPAKAKGAKALKLGELKDLAAAHGEFTVKGLKLDEDRRTFEAGRIAAQHEFDELLRALPADAIKPEAMTKLRGTLQARQKEQRELALERIPSWQDPAVRAAELKGIVEHMRGYDIPESWLLTHFSAPLIALLRDSWQRAETIRKALEAVEERKPTNPPKGKAHGTAPVKRAANGAGPPSRQQSNVGAFMNAITSAAQSRRSN